MEHLHPLHSVELPPARFTYPFAYEPHPLCRQAAAEVQRHVAEHVALRADADRGKMFGVLVVAMPPTIDESSVAATAAGGVAFLAAYSGLLAGRNDWPYFVPPSRPRNGKYQP